MAACFIQYQDCCVAMVYEPQLPRRLRDCMSCQLLAAQAYLSQRFGLKSGDRPHLMKF